MLVDIAAEVDDALLDRIRSLGGTIVSSQVDFGTIRADVPLDAVPEIAASEGVDTVRTGYEPVTWKDDTSEGDVAHRADVVRADSGFTGDGVKTCVISDTVEALAPLQASGDLPDVEVLPGQAGADGVSEGTAMLEIVHDLAPDSDLAFATAQGGQGAFAQNIIDLGASGCDVIVDDIIYPTEPVFQDGIVAAAVDAVVADGALYYSSAGNYGNLNDGTSGVWEGDFKGVTAGDFTFHDFGGGVIENTITSNTRLITLQWAEAAGEAATDYDLVLFDPAGDIAESSLQVQDGEGGDDFPFEGFALDPAVDYTGYTLAVVLFSGTPRYFNLNAWQGELDLATEGATWGHSAAAGSISVAAVDQATSAGGPFVGGATNPVEDFSSDGPRRVFFDVFGTPYTPGNSSATGGVVRQVPTIAAADGVATATPGFSPFFGTSAAAPHAAAIGALMLEARPDLRNNRIRDVFEDSALDIEAPGFDRDSGYGIVDAVTAVEASIALPDIVPEFIPVGPTRAVDTRPNGRLRAGETLVVDVGSEYAGRSLSVNLTVPGALSPGFATLYACDQSRPNTSSLNYQAGEPIANGVITKVSAQGTVCVYLSQPGHVVVDVFGVFPEGSSFTPVGPTRAIDTRETSRVGAGRTLTVRVGAQYAGQSLSVNLTVPGALSPGFATLYACDQDRPSTSSLNYQAGQPIANGVITKVSAQGTVCVYLSQPGHVLVDVFGVFPDELAFTPVGPDRAIDTRPSIGRGGAGDTLAIPVGVEYAGLSLSVNLTVPGALSPGFATLYACDQSRPNTSSLNYQTGEPIANGVITKVSAQGTVCVYISQPGHVVLDVFGVFPI